MELKDFKIGDAFYTGSGKWICIDVGSRAVVAAKYEDAMKQLKRFNPEFDPTINDIAAYGDLVSSVVFWKDDFGGCSRDPNRFRK